MLFVWQRAFKNTVDPLSVTEEGREPVEEQNGDTKSGKIISRSSHRMLNHVIFKILIMAVAFGNCILIGFWTNPAVVKVSTADFQRECCRGLYLCELLSGMYFKRMLFLTLIPGT
ncbi:hypothetical protein AOLI_G00114860 [Acnodon oligacanthus]